MARTKAVQVQISPHGNASRDDELIFPGGFRGELPKYATLISRDTGAKVLVRPYRWPGNLDQAGPIIVTLNTFNRLSGKHLLSYQQAMLPRYRGGRRRRLSNAWVSYAVEMRPASRWEIWRERLFANRGH